MSDNHITKNNGLISLFQISMAWQQIQTLVFIEGKDSVLWQLLAKFWLYVSSLGKQSDSPVTGMPRTHCLHSPTSGRSWLSWVDSEFFQTISLKWSCLKETHRTNSYQLLPSFLFEWREGMCGFVEVILLVCSITKSLYGLAMVNPHHLYA